jgi:hypothetical protein
MAGTLAASIGPVGTVDKVKAGTGMSTGWPGRRESGICRDGTARPRAAKWRWRVPKCVEQGGVRRRTVHPLEIAFYVVIGLGAVYVLGVLYVIVGERFRK